MASILVTTTRRDGLRPLGTDGQRLHASLVRVLAREIGTAAAGLLAEPVPNPNGIEIDWYVEDEAPARPAASLPAADRAALEARFAETAESIRTLAARYRASGDTERLRLAQALENALEVPGQDYLYAVGERPVLVAWAHLQDRPDAPVGVLSRLVRPPPGIAVPVSGPSVSTTATPVAAMGGAAAGIGAGARRAWHVGWLWWPLWLLLGLLLAMIFYLVLTACAVRGIGWLQHCPMPAGAPSGLAVAAERGNALEAEIAELERRLATASSECRPTERAAVEPEPPPPEPPPPPQPLPEPEPEPPPAPAPPQPPPAPQPPPPPEPEPAPPPARDVFDERREAAGGEAGDLTITLIWNTTDDIDLHVRCPNGQVIYYGSRRNCGGALDVDQNANFFGRTSRPVENVFWRGMAPPGRYEIRVNFFAANAGLPRSRARPFDVKVQKASGDLFFRGEVSPTSPNRTFNFDYP